MIPLLLLTSTTMVLCENMNAGSKPNVVILFVDDWGWGDMGANCLAAAEVSGVFFFLLSPPEVYYYYLAGWSTKHRRLTQLVVLGIALSVSVPDADVSTALQFLLFFFNYNVGARCPARPH